MTIVGVGVDLVDLKRFEQSLQRSPGLRERLFTAAERALADASLAARFAAKEAMAKALGCPAGLAWTDVEVVTDESGRPGLVCTGTVADAMAAAGAARCFVSLSHDGGHAVAVVVLEGAAA
jgi:holo-[acyl-carrier protein] synthase